MKEAYYFSHDSNARHDPKISAMRGVYGAEGYGWYWMLIEMMRDSSDYKLEMQSKYAFNAFALQLQANHEQIEVFVHDCIHEFKLFESDDIAFWSRSLLRRMDKREEVREKRSAAAKARWDKEKEGSEQTNNMQMHATSNANAMQGKESKGKERKGNIKEIKDISTQIVDFRSRYQPELLNLIDQYFTFISDMRKSKKISEGIIVKVYEQFKRFSPNQVECGIRTHMGSVKHSGAKEEYTFGIIRNCTEEEASKKLIALRSGKTRPNTPASGRLDFIDEL